MKKYFRNANIEDSRIDDEIVEILIDTIEKGHMRYFTEWNVFAWLSGYFGTKPKNLTKVLNSIGYVFENCSDIKNGELLRSIENWDRYN